MTNLKFLLQNADVIQNQMFYIYIILILNIFSRLLTLKFLQYNIIVYMYRVIDFVFVTQKCTKIDNITILIAVIEIIKI